MGSRSRAAALYRIPITLMLLGLFMMALQAGQPLLGIAMLMTAAAATLGSAWRAGGRREAVMATLREQADAKLVDGRYREARALYERSLSLAQGELPPAAPELLVNYYSLAAVNSMLHDHARAGRYLEELLRGLDDRVPAAWSGHVAWLMRRVAHHRSLHGHHADAQRLCRRALELVGDAPGADDNTVRSLLDDLAWVEHHAGAYARAEALFREALAVHEQFRDVALELARQPSRGPRQGRSPYREPGPATVSTSGGLDRAVAYTLLGLGWTIYERGRYEDARHCFDRAGMIATRLSGSPGRASLRERERGLEVEVCRGRAAVAVTLGQYDQAQALYGGAVQHSARGEATMQRAALLVDMGWLARCRGRFDQAEAIGRAAQQAVARMREGTAAIASALKESLAELRRRQGRIREGQRHIREAQELAEQGLGLEHPRMAGILAVTARLHVARSELTEAERCARHSLTLFKESLGIEHPRVSDAYLALGEVQLARGQLGAADRSLSLALGLREQALGKDHPELAEILESQVAVMRASGREDEAQPVEVRAAALRKRAEVSGESEAVGDSIPAS
ncbi:MAG: tetratricopeptide repeat protein [Deltaproteobacteria bacterium]|nr:tetratricopeptide repeat protein [Deltaproteobacteria bacterium]